MASGLLASCTKVEREYKYSQDLEERIFSNFGETDEHGCILWNGSMGDEKTPIITFQSERISVVRWIWEYYHEPLGEKFVVRKCENKNCVNVDHLIRATGPRQKMTEVQVIELKRLLKLETPYSALRKKFGITPARISRIKTQMRLNGELDRIAG